MREGIMSHHVNRRGFLKSSALGAAGATAINASDTVATPGKRDVDLVRVGMLCVGSDTHTRGIWGPLINPIEGNTRQTGMIMTHCWDIDPEVSKAFGEKFGCTPVKNYEDMVGKVDGIIHGSYASNPVNHILAQPYLEAKVPIFINRPFSNSLAKTRIIIDKAKEYGTPLMCASSFEFTRDVEVMRSKVKNFKVISGYSATNSMSDYSTHGIHGIYALYRCLGGPVTGVSYNTKDWTKPNGLMVFEHPGKDGGDTFYGTLQHIRGGLTNFSLKVWTQGAEFFEQLWYWERGPYDRDTFMWVPMLIAMQRMFETGELHEPYENIYEKTALYLAGFKSHLEHGGAMVRLADLPHNWEAPLMKSGHWQPSLYDKLLSVE